MSSSSKKQAIRLKRLIDRPTGKPFQAGDGALVHELFRAKQRSRNVTLAVGSLKPKQAAVPHFHKKTEEIYYVLSGRGRIHLNNTAHTIREGDAILVPKNTTHALENTSPRQKLKVLAISSPPYSSKDHFPASH